MRKRVALCVVIACAIMLPASHSAMAGPKKGRDYYESRGEIVWEVPTNEKVIALTFDDGPHETDTALILDVLKQYNAKATFFVVGNKVERFPELIRREIAEGHELANHTYSHSYFGKNLSVPQFTKDLERAEDVIFAAGGKHCHLFRPPGGFYSEKLVETAKGNGYTVVMWSWHQDTRDWATPGVQKIVGRVLENTRGGDIVLFHDYVEGKSQTVEALKIILPELQERGFRFVTVSELLTYSKLKPVRTRESK